VEVCFLLADDGTVLWTDRSTSPMTLPDSRARWQAIWRYRKRLAEIAHSHPNGLLAFSAEDETTMTAIDAALGRPLRYAAVTAEAMVRRHPDGATGLEREEPSWAAALRDASDLTGGKTWRF